VIIAEGIFTIYLDNFYCGAGLVLKMFGRLKVQSYNVQHLFLAQM